jgi:hypothetical protein
MLVVQVFRVSQQLLHANLVAGLGPRPQLLPESYVLRNGVNSSSD